MKRPSRKLLPSNSCLRSLSASVLTLAIVLFEVTGVAVWAGEPSRVRPLRTLSLDQVGRLFPSTTHLLLSPGAIEDFLDRLDRSPPDWASVYGTGHGDPGHDDRLFQLNRQRDASRVGNETLHWRVAFVWAGELTDYDPKAAGFGVGIGPQLTKTRWGVVRFKPEGLPGNLMAIPNPQVRKTLRRRFDRGERIEVSLVMLGHLIPEESIVYDFSHDEEGVGMVMPVIQVERIEIIVEL